MEDEKSIAIVKKMVKSIFEVKEKVMGLIKMCGEDCYCDRDEDPWKFIENVYEFGCYFGNTSIPQLFFHRLYQELPEGSKVGVSEKTTFMQGIALLIKDDKLLKCYAEGSLGLDCSHSSLFKSLHRTFKIQKFNLDDVDKLKEPCGNNPYHIGSILFIGHQLAIVAEHGQNLSTAQNNVLGVLAKDIKDYALGGRTHTFNALRDRLGDFIKLLEA